MLGAEKSYLNRRRNPTNPVSSLITQLVSDEVMRPTCCRCNTCSIHSSRLSYSNGNVTSPALIHVSRLEALIRLYLIQKSKMRF